MDVASIVERCKADLDLETATLSDEYYYQSLPLCVLDAVYSIGVSYESTRNTVIRYCDYFGLQRIGRGEPYPPAPERQESIPVFVHRIEHFGVELFAGEILRNKQRTSTTNGVLKAEAVYRFARALAEFGVNYLQDLPKVLDSAAFERAIMAIPGQTSGISLRYFFMLAGSDDLIKPDRMIIRFLEETIGRPVGLGEAQELLTGATVALRGEYPGLTARLLDHRIWGYQRGR